MNNRVLPWIHSWTDLLVLLLNVEKAEGGTENRSCQPGCCPSLSRDAPCNPPWVARSPTNLRNDWHWARTLMSHPCSSPGFIILALSIYSVPSSHFVCIKEAKWEFKSYAFMPPPQHLLYPKIASSYVHSPYSSVNAQLVIRLNRSRTMSLVPAQFTVDVSGALWLLTYKTCSASDWAKHQTVAYLRNTHWASVCWEVHYTLPE